MPRTEASRVRWLLGLALLAAGCTRAVAPLPVVPEPSPTPVAPVALPRDGRPHDALTEWWYYTGHLQSPTDGREYGFEFTIFQAQRQDAPSGLLAHFAVSDIAAQQFSHQMRFAQLGPAMPDFPLDVDGWTLSSDGGGDTIEAHLNPAAGVGQPFSLQLRLRDDKRPALHHGGYIEYGSAGGSYYYSRTRLSVSGSLRVGDGEPVAVTGLAWMDHQWGNFVVASGGGWDWYSLQLSDLSELMLYVLRAPDGNTTGLYGTEILPDGTVRDLAPGTVTADSLATWVSPHTGGVYPAGWLLTLPDGTRLTVRPRVADQELYFPDVDDAYRGVGVMAYWEGAVTVSGDRQGQGYVELTGYATRPR